MIYVKPRAKLLFVHKGETHIIYTGHYVFPNQTSEAVKHMCKQTWGGMVNFFPLSKLKMEHDGWMMVPDDGPEVNEYGEVAP